MPRRGGHNPLLASGWGQGYNDICLRCIRRSRVADTGIMLNLGERGPNSRRALVTRLKFDVRFYIITGALHTRPLQSWPALPPCTLSACHTVTQASSKNRRRKEGGAPLSPLIKYTRWGGRLIIEMQGTKITEQQKTAAASKGERETPQTRAAAGGGGARTSCGYRGGCGERRSMQPRSAKRAEATNHPAVIDALGKQGRSGPKARAGFKGAAAEIQPQRTTSPLRQPPNRNHF